MITKEQIELWLAIDNNNGDNKQPSSYFADNSLKTKLVEAKVLVDRWAQVSTDIIVHSSNRDFFRLEFGNTINIANDNTNQIIDQVSAIIEDDQMPKTMKLSKIAELISISKTTKTDMLWGAVVHYSDDCPRDKGIMVARITTKDGTTNLQIPEKPSRSIAVFPMGVRI